LAENKNKLFGIIPPIVIPFDKDGEIDLESFRSEIRYLIKTGINGISVGGSTGEGSTLLDDELRLLVKTAGDEMPENMPLIVGIITDSTTQVLRKVEKIKEFKVDGLMITPIHYLFADGDRGIYNFYKEIKDKAKLPIIVYNVVPWNIASVNVLVKMTEEGIIDGIKQSNGDMHSLMDLIYYLKGKVPIFTAIDDSLFASFILGADGSIAATNTVLPKSSVKLYKLVKEGNYKEALALNYKMLPVIRSYYLRPNMPSLIKWLMNKSGHNVGYARRPIMPLDATEESELTKIVNKIIELES